MVVSEDSFSTIVVRAAWNENWKKYPAIGQHLKSGLKWMIKCSETESGTKTSASILSMFRHEVLLYIIMCSLLTISKYRYE